MRNIVKFKNLPFLDRFKILKGITPENIQIGLTGQNTLFKNGNQGGVISLRSYIAPYHYHFVSLKISQVSPIGDFLQGKKHVLDKSAC